MSGLFDKFGAADYLATSPRRIDELRRAGKLIAVADGRTYKYTVSDLDAFIQSLPTSAEVSL
jgi:hypothetical protein